MWEWEGLLQGAHPRVCGENSCGPLRALQGLGSSPRVRGKQQISTITRARAGLIPACAGKTRRMVISPRRRPAHPRVCGENAEPPAESWRVAGSSPRVRGKPQSRVIQFHANRLIPACAGKTSAAGFSSVAGAAHPRVCGENFYDAVRASPALGSSPRVRGKLLAAEHGFQSRGLIPACAGKTRGWSSR